MIDPLIDSKSTPPRNLHPSVLLTGDVITGRQERIVVDGAERFRIELKSSFDITFTWGLACPLLSSVFEGKSRRYAH